MGHGVAPWGMESTQSKIVINTGPRDMVGRLIVPQVAPKVAIVIHGATAVPHEFYRRFAEWLAQTQQAACLIYDYSDFGASRTGPLRQNPRTMADWGVTDQQAARDWLCARYPDLPLWVVGHSLGGLMIPFQRDLHRINRVITVASGLVHVRDHPWPYQATARLFWWGIGPVMTGVFGYLPHSVTRLGGDLPPGVFRQWRRWCTTPGFHAPDIGRDLPPPNFSGLRAQVDMISLSDDQMCPSVSVARMAQSYPNGMARHVVLTPESVGLSQVGHIAAFSHRSAAIWPALIGA